MMACQGVAEVTALPVAKATRLEIAAPILMTGKPLAAERHLEQEVPILMSMMKEIYLSKGMEYCPAQAPGTKR